MRNATKVASAVRGALYARYSTELQSADSIEDQFRVCQRLAERHGFTVIERYSDAAISGGTTERPGYQELLRAGRAKQFDVIVAEDTSRLWRSLPEQWRAVAELLDAGVHIVTQDIDTRSENFKILLSVHGAMADVYRDQIAYRTRRGLEGRARKGKSTGGKAYGYKPGVDAKGEKIRVVDAEQAKVVKQIYEWRAAGWSGQRIARQLNEDRVPPPGAYWNRTDTGPNRKNTAGGWTHSAIVGDPKRGVGLLNNPLYRAKWCGRARSGRVAVDHAARRIVAHRERRIVEPSACSPNSE
jgi:site-specific DNA recombinase